MSTIRKVAAVLLLGTVLSGARAAAASFLAVLAGPTVHSATGKAYYLLGPSTWLEAKAAAEALGGRLATIRSEAEHDWIYEQFGFFGGAPRNLWIGLYDPDPAENAGDPIERRTEFRWVSGEPVSYTRWSAGEPNNGWQQGIPEAYVHIWQPGLGVSGTWNDLPNDPFPFYEPHGVVEAAPLEVTFPWDTRAHCPFTGPDVTGRPSVERACGRVEDAVILPHEDDFPFPGSIERRWVVRDACGQTAEWVQTIEVEGTFDGTMTGTFAQGGLLATFAIVADGFIGATWFLDDRPVFGEEGLHRLDAGRMLQIDFTVFRGGSYGEEAPEGREYTVRASVRTECAEGTVQDGGATSAVFRLGRGLPVVGGATFSTPDGQGVTLPCGRFDNDSRVFRLLIQDGGVVRLEVGAGGLNPRVGLRMGPLDAVPPKGSPAASGRFAFPRNRAPILAGSTPPAISS